jgi:hypothetical protein
MSKTKIKSIPFEEIIDIQISGAFYMRIQNVFLEMISKLSDEDQKQLLQKVKENSQDITDPAILNAITILILMNEIEHQANSQGKVKDQEVDIPENGTDL